MDARTAQFDEPLRPVAGFMFDVDGTLILSNRALGGYTLLPGADETLRTLKERKIPFVALTNGSAYPPAEQAAKLRALGLPIDDEAMLTPSSIAADLMVRHGVGRVLLLGTPGVGYCLAEAGIEIVVPTDPAADQVDAIYVGWHPDCGMHDIHVACGAIWNGAKLYVASNVPFFASSTGKAPGYSYVITAAIRKLTRAPMILTGKPSLDALRFVARKLDVPMKSLAVVGDDPLVEIVMARRAGAMAFGVTTGTTSAEEWAQQPPIKRPHRILGGVADVLSLETAPA